MRIENAYDTGNIGRGVVISGLPQSKNKKKKEKRTENQRVRRKQDELENDGKYRSW